MVNEPDFDIPISPFGTSGYMFVRQTFGTGSNAKHTMSNDLQRYIKPFWKKSKIKGER